MDDDYDGDNDSQDTAGDADSDEDTARHIMRGGYLKGQR